MARFVGKTVIVTGAGSGIGAATARLFSAEGANVVFNGRTEDKLAAAADGLPAERTLIVAGDVGAEDDGARLASATQARFGAVDVLVNNAGTASMAPIEDFARADWDKIIRTNLTGLYLVTRSAWPALKAAGGNVVNVSSVSGLGGDWTGFAYNASKGGVSNLTRALALDFNKSGVRVNAVAPSLTKSEMTAGIMGNDTMLAKFAERIPMGRPAEAEEVGRAIVWLASAEAGFVNGVILPVDGGLSASNGQPPLG